MTDKRCLYGVKKNGECKKKPGPKPKRSKSRSKSRSRRKSKRRSRKRKTTYMTEARCKSELKEKIKINMREYKEGKYNSRQQAIAVAYSVLSRKYPNCKKIFNRLRERL